MDGNAVKVHRTNRLRMPFPVIPPYFGATKALLGGFV